MFVSKGAPKGDVSDVCDVIQDTKYIKCNDFGITLEEEDTFPDDSSRK